VPAAAGRLAADQCVGRGALSPEEELRVEGERERVALAARLGVGIASSCAPRRARRRMNLWPPPPRTTPSPPDRHAIQGWERARRDAQARAGLGRGWKRIRRTCSCRCLVARGARRQRTVEYTGSLRARPEAWTHSDVAAHRSGLSSLSGPGAMDRAAEVDPCVGDAARLVGDGEIVVFRQLGSLRVLQGVLLPPARDIDVLVRCPEVELVSQCRGQALMGELLLVTTYERHGVFPFVVWAPETLCGAGRVWRHRARQS
jgi:hypothetical protein